MPTTRIKSQRERGDPHAPRSPNFREQAILTIKIILIASGTLGVLGFLERFIAE